MHAASSRREQRRVPAEEPLRREWLVVALRRVEHHRDNAFHVAIRDVQPADVDAKPPRDRRAHQIAVQLFSLDFTALPARPR
jgi:hypothetical protein